MTEDGRFWDKVERGGEHSCWEWTACKNTTGYGIFTVGGRNVVAHRWSYESLVGPVPDGLDLDHLCRNRACVNPNHLEPVTRQENLLRGDTHAAKNAAKTHCPKGHSYSGENLYVRHGRRYCRTCQRATARRRSIKKRQEKVA